MKTNEMTRIFKEFQRNDYENRFYTDKITVISALLGEDNLNSELVKQSKREKRYIEEIMKGRMHKKMKSVDKALIEKNIIGDSVGLKLNSMNTMNQMVKSMGHFEVRKSITMGKNIRLSTTPSSNYRMTF